MTPEPLREVGASNSRVTEEGLGMKEGICMTYPFNVNRQRLVLNNIYSDMQIIKIYPSLPSRKFTFAKKQID
jgi:hypothetical protein